MADKKGEAGETDGPRRHKLTRAGGDTGDTKDQKITKIPEGLDNLCGEAIAAGQRVSQGGNPQELQLLQQVRSLGGAAKAG